MTHDVKALTTARAAAIAAEWGSCMTADDPGAIFYTFPDKGRPDWSANDRDAMICQVDLRLDRMGAHPGFIESEDQANLWSLRAWVIDRYGEPGEALKAGLAQGLDDFTRGYVEAALWTAEADEMTPEDLGDDVLSGMIDDCVRFRAENTEALAAVIGAQADGKLYDDPRAGHDFWLTRNGHGSGFWGRGFTEPAAQAAAEVLSEACRRWPEVNLDIEAPGAGDDEPDLS